MIDLKELGAIIANILGAVALLAVVIFAIVAYLKQWGVQGKWLTGSAFIVGVVIALVVRYAMSPMQTFADWTWAALFGIMAGALATGAYKGAESVALKSAMVKEYHVTNGTTSVGYSPTLIDALGKKDAE